MSSLRSTKSTNLGATSAHQDDLANSCGGSLFVHTFTQFLQMLQQISFMHSKPLHQCDSFLQNGLMRFLDWRSEHSVRQPCSLNSLWTLSTSAEGLFAPVYHVHNELKVAKCVFFIYFLFFFFKAAGSQLTDHFHLTHVENFMLSFSFFLFVFLFCMSVIEVHDRASRKQISRCGNTPERSFVLHRRYLLTGKQAKDNWKMPC